LCTEQALKPRSYNQLPPAPVSFAGIDINHVASDFTVSGPAPALPADAPINPAGVNRFIGLLNGIRAYNSTLIVSGAYFEDILKNGYDTGYGILFAGPGHLRQTGLGRQQVAGAPPGAQAATPSFTNCTTGIEVWGGNAKISDNRMLEMESGIVLEGGQMKDVTVHNNYIEATWEGISAKANSPSIKFLIEENSIKMNMAGDTCHAGIGIYEGLVPNGNATVQNNDIEGSARYGILAQYAIKWQILENIITNNLAIGDGINLLGSQNSTIKCNRIGGDVSNGRAGLSTENSTEIALHCNTSVGFQVGAYFTGTNTTTDFRGNTMEDNDIGLYLDTTIINAQLHKGNMWVGSFGSNGARFDAIESEDLQFSQFLVDTLDASFLWPPNIFPDGDWFLPDPGNTYFCPVGINGCLPGINEELAPQETDVLVASGGILHPVLRWIAEKDLYRKMQKNPGFGAGINVYGSFEDSRENGPVGKFYALYQGIEAAFAADSSQQALYRIGQDTIWVLLDSMANVTTELITETGMDSAALVIIRDALFERIAAKAAIQDSLYALILTNRSLRADTLLAENAAITVQKLYESNEKSVAGIFLSIIMKGAGSFTSTQEKTLQAIASQCPWVGGDAVYAARSLYRLIEPKSYYDDAVLCGKGSIPQAMQRQENFPKEYNELEPQNEQISSETLEVAVYPNPTRDVVHIAFSSQPEGVLETRLLTLQGRSLDRQAFEVASSNFSLSTENLSAGMYFLQIRVGGQLITTKRIVIIR